MSVINSLDSLLAFLPICDSEHLVQLPRKLDLNVDEFASFQHWSDEKYTRNCIARTDHYEALLLCWEPGQYTPVHSHGGKNCLVHMLSGNLVEKRYQQEDDLVETSKQAMVSGDSAYMHDSMGYHTLTNLSGERAMTLHIYMNPIYQCEVYNPTLKEFDVRQLSDHSFQGELLNEVVGL